MATRSQFSKTLAATSIAQGFKGTAPEMAREVLDMWCEGVRGVMLPYGLIGMSGGHILNELDADNPGSIGKLAKR